MDTDVNVVIQESHLCNYSRGIARTAGYLTTVEAITSESTAHEAPTTTEMDARKRCIEMQCREDTA